MKKIVFSLFILFLCVTPLFVSTALKKTTVTYADQCDSEVYSLSECYPSAVNDVFDLVTKELIDFYEKDFNPATWHGVPQNNTDLPSLSNDLILLKQALTSL